MQDLTGQIFGNILVVGLNEEKSKEATVKYNHKRYIWDCVCSVCQNKTSKLTQELKTIKKNGKTGCINCNLKDLTGMKVGRLTVLGLADEQVTGKQMWLCQCSCGNIVTHQTSDLCKKNPIQSCGCLHKEILSERNKENAKHNGDSMNPQYARLHRIWRAMQHRCEFETDEHYDLYGGRGIKVCEEWHEWETFKQWALNNGYRDDLSIDRIDTNGNYEPNNCRWATTIEQGNNRRDNKMLPYHGKTQSLADWCRELSLDYHRTKARLNSCGYTVEQAFELEKYAAQKQNNNKRFGVDPTKLQPLPT